MTQNKSLTLGELSSLLGTELIGDASKHITGIGTLRNASSDQITFLSNISYKDQLAETSAAAVILSPNLQSDCNTACLLSKQPYVTFAKATAIFDTSPDQEAGVHSSSIVDESVVLGEGVSVGPNCVLEAGVELGRGVKIGSGTYVGADVKIGDNSTLQANVTVYHSVVIGCEVNIHSASVIGADGFGFAFDGEKSIKIHQLGSVLIGDNVDIGSGTTIDRGALEDTVIKEGVKIDNQVQIGHNCIIGEHTIICGCVALAGSVTIGKYCIMGGASGAVGHITIADKTQVSAMSLVSQSITEPAMYSSGTGHMKTTEWKRAIVRFQQLDNLAKRVKKLENKQED